jgi:hypothetical protein
LDRFKLGDGLVKLPPLFGIAERCLQRGSGDAESERADADAPAIQNRERVSIAVVEVAEQILFRHPDLFQPELRSIRSSHPELIFDAHNLQSRSLPFHDER